MVDQGVTAAMAARDANRNGDDSHTSGTVFVCHHLFQCPPWHCMGGFRSSGLNVGVPP
nr:hypothetical protein [Tanacetum cinerariifolium]